MFDGSYMDFLESGFARPYGADGAYVRMHDNSSFQCSIGQFCPRVCYTRLYFTIFLCQKSLHDCIRSYFINFLNFCYQFLSF